ncbi:MAG: tryptophan synthase subunit alpha [Myxococcota bacterium]|nr:tryptophan synthase subunit alpha [Myxococcota bacterium]
MGRYEKMFARLQEKREGAFVPFVAIGDPNIELSKKIIQAMVEGGADALELGIPFSDPIADGPTIQAAAVRALDQGVTPDQCFEVLGSIRATYPDIPIGLLVYANLVAANGKDRFFEQVARAGVDSVLVADLPVFEAGLFLETAAKHGVQMVFIAPPNADEKKLAEIAGITQGYTYVVARAGVTGADDQVDLKHQNIFGALKRQGAPPSLVGFGISRPEHVKTALSSGAAGAISGSAAVGIIERNLSDSDKLLRELKAFVQSMKAATALV